VNCQSDPISVFQLQIKHIYWFIYDILGFFSGFVIKGVPGEVRPARGFFRSIPECSEGVPGMSQGVPSLFLVLQTVPYTHVHNFSKKLICIEKDWPSIFFWKKSPKYANVEEMVNTMSLASLFHHVERRNKSLCNRFCIHVSVPQYKLSFSLVRRLLNMTGK